MITSFVLQGILAVLFLSLGIQKIMGHELQVDIFKDLKLPQWLRLVTGWVEIVGAAGLIIGFWLPGVVVIAGLWFAVTMLVGMITHIRVKDSFSKTAPAFVLMVISIILSTLNFSELQSFLS
ncbi:DoxX family protein [Virgibacillus ihumii]|uniref:DoxX family protein n=1 Tax=Virgibacillus ihumii TaxID=2686091 RepID=UPI00157C432D|nr:DoxX family protein [Virgibacillus ihumii]